MHRQLYIFSALAFSAMFATAPNATAQDRAMGPAAQFAGCYAGVHGGGLVGRTSSREQFADYASRFGEQKATVSALLAGGQLGCNWASGDLVFGVEGEAFRPFENDGSTARQIVGQPMYRNRLTYSSQGGGAVSLRAGTVYNSILMFGKLGLAYAPMTVIHDYRYGSYPATSIPGPGQPFENGQNVDTRGRLARASLLLGAGVEYALTPDWSLKAEYNALITMEGSVSAKGTLLNYSYSTTDGSYSEQPLASVTRAKTMSEMRNIVKIGVNRRF